YNSWCKPRMEWDELSEKFAEPNMTITSLNCDPEVHDLPIRVLKMGAATGLTTGKLNGLVNSVQLDDLPKKTMEYTVIGDKKVFSLNRDSGAVIVDEDGRIIGLLF